jgi:Protein of unknown function (DUF3089)
LPVTCLLFSIFCVTGLTSCSNSPAAAATVWLCRPGLAHDPCTASLETTVVNGTGSKRVVDYEPASHPAIDCFYVYPLVSLQTTPNTTLRIDPQETAIAELEASPFSRVCRVFAPMYQQVTLSSVSSQQAQQVAYDSVLAAWRDYLAHYNDGRGVVLIGHSEGADELDQLISGQIDNDASVRRLLVSAILTGANLTVGANGTGPFSKISACRSASQTGCVVAYSAFFQPPPSDALFGRPDPTVLNGIAQQEVCTNPAALAGGTGTLVSAYRVQHSMGQRPDRVVAPPPVAGQVIDADLLAGAQRGQARPVVQAILQLVDLGCVGIGAGDGQQLAVWLQGDPARQALAQRAGRQDGQLA